MNDATKQHNLYLNRLEGAAEQHVVGGDQCTYRVVMSTDSIDFLQGLDVPHLCNIHTQQKDINITSIAYANKSNGASFLLQRGSRKVNVTYDDGAVCRTTV